MCTGVLNFSYYISPAAPFSSHPSRILRCVSFMVSVSTGTIHSRSPNANKSNLLSNAQVGNSIAPSATLLAPVGLHCRQRCPTFVTYFRILISLLTLWRLEMYIFVLVSKYRRKACWINIYPSKCTAVNDLLIAIGSQPLVTKFFLKSSGSEKECNNNKNSDVTS